MRVLVVPGVSVEARFDVVPPPPARSGIVGAVGIVDRVPTDGDLVPVTNVSELRERFGVGTVATMPEIVHALSNGAAEAVVSPVLGGARASALLLNAASQPVVRLRCRCPGAWGNSLRASVRALTNADGAATRVTITLYGHGESEVFSDLRVAPGAPDDLLEAINQRSRLVVATDPGFDDSSPRPGTYTFDADHTSLTVPETATEARVLFELLPARGIDPNGLQVRLAAADDRIDVFVSQNGPQEELLGLSMDPDDPLYLPTTILQSSRLLRVRLHSSRTDDLLPISTTQPVVFTGGVSPSVDDYSTAIDELAHDARIDLVLASIEPKRSESDVRDIHQALLAHALSRAEGAMPCIAFGSVTETEAGKIESIRDHAALLRNRRFVLIAPPGSHGAVAGTIASMNPQDSPTFKKVPLVGIKPASYSEGELNRLLGSSINLCVVQDREGRGVVVLRGLDTSGDQISVTRVADQCVRETKAISEGFIGQLNTEEARIALKQQVIAAFTRMERAGALVPSTDGKSPAFLVDVYSTQQDFGAGIVRLDIAVRPVRAIDYVYATIHVRN